MNSSKCDEFFYDGKLTLKHFGFHKPSSGL